MPKKRIVVVDSLMGWPESEMSFNQSSASVDLKVKPMKLFSFCSFYLKVSLVKFVPYALLLNSHYEKLSSNIRLLLLFGKKSGLISSNLATNQSKQLPTIQNLLVGK